MPMSRTILFAILNLVGFYLLFNWLYQLVKEYKIRDRTVSFFTAYRFRYLLMLVIAIGIPFFLLNYTTYFNAIHIELDKGSLAYTFFFCGALAFITSLIWLDYVLKLDIHEKTKKHYVWMVFILSIFFTHYLTGPLYNFVGELGYSLNGEPFNDFLYCVFSIGLIEEIVKLIPFLIILRFTKIIKEPYDYLLFASVSALGFAFVENVTYLNRFGAEIILARTFYAAVAHMTFSSTIAYGLLLKKYRFFKTPKFLIYGIFFLIAIFAHGFYDFWLINPAVSKFTAFTTLFFMITIHLWFTMNNNAINISNFFSPKANINNDRLKYQLVKNFLSLITFSYIYVAFSKSIPDANVFLIETSLTYGYMMFYLVVGLTRFNVVRGYLKPFQVPFNFIVPSFKKRK